ncbi:MAG: tRNA (adenosine(37)-N6)-threonylcarbamoyltransferase complex dimerization subunit type 1 TsaB [Rhodospirillales bacterium]|nr:tRNA (adenosine(37)-N6)-threonylcarbamoyltransferase complex dimerization subunit type 1 TsaB [Rhodospirillales bacterium]MBO6787559.1 tRNA (adenosine(37)-N6)-threonylcarbamoyltransferase complex dimerization subunit type 1 TsaB [Rhodospirillales bacterium]
MTVLLGIDTATSGCAVAVVRDAETLACQQARMARGQSEALMPMIDQVVAEAGISFPDIDAVAVTRGPGAFTGLRIGLATARALALAIGKPCLGVGTFDALLAEARDRSARSEIDAFVVAVDSKREEVFVAIFDSGGVALGAPAALLPQQVAGHLGSVSRVAVVGDSSGVVADALESGFHVDRIAEIELPDPAIVARLAMGALEDPERMPAAPLYLRPPDVSLPKA